MTALANRPGTPRAARPQQPPIACAAGVLDLVDRSRDCLLEACHQSDLVERYRCAQLGALRAAAALVAARSARSPRSRPRSVWQVVGEAVPELREWAEFFAGTGKRGVRRVGVRRLGVIHPPDPVRLVHDRAAVALDAVGPQAVVDALRRHPLGDRDRRGRPRCARRPRVPASSPSCRRRWP